MRASYGPATWRWGVVGFAAALLAVPVGCGSRPAGPLARPIDPSLVLARHNESLWQADGLAGGVITVRLADAKIVIERLGPPWQEPVAEPVPEVAAGPSLQPIAFDRFGARLFLFAPSKSPARPALFIWDRAKRKLAPIVEPTAAYPGSCAYSPDGKLLSYSDRGGTRVCLADQAKVLGRAEGAIAVAADARTLAWRPASDAVVIGTADYVTVLTAPDWKAKPLKTASRNQAEWERSVALGKEETGFRPHEMVSAVAFDDTGELLFIVMDRGLRVYRWSEVAEAVTQLPKPLHQVDNELVRMGTWFSSLHRMSYAVDVDPVRKLALWSGLEGKIFALDLASGTNRTLLAFPPDHWLTRLALLPGGEALACEVATKGGGFATGEYRVLALWILDYPKLLARAAGPRKTRKEIGP